MDEAGKPFLAVMREGLFLGLVTELELAVVADRLAQAQVERPGRPRGLPVAHLK